MVRALVDAKVSTEDLFLEKEMMEKLKKCGKSFKWFQKVLVSYWVLEELIEHT